MKEAKTIAKRVVDGLDAARKVSSRERPVNELGLIAAAIDDAIAERDATLRIFRKALTDIANSAEYQGGGCGTKLGRAIDIAKSALGATQ